MERAFDAAIEPGESSEIPRGFAFPIVVPIDTLTPEPIDIVKPFHAVVQAVDGEYVATFFDANINASGDTQQEAIFNLKDMIVTLFNRVERKPSKQLGAALRRQKSVLCAMLKRRK